MNPEANTLGQIANLEMAGDTRTVRFSYSRPEQSLYHRTLIRAIEAMTGQRRLSRLYRQWSSHPLAGENIFAVAVRLLRLPINADEQAWEKLPRHGGLLIVSNHPFGVIDGIVIGHLATRYRSDTKIMTHSLLCQPKEARDFLLPVAALQDSAGGHPSISTA